MRSNELPLYESNPTPDIVNRYRDPTTGLPDPRKLRYEGPRLQRSDQSDRGLRLANISRQQTNQIMSYDILRDDRKKKYLQSDRGFWRESIDPQRDIHRYHPLRRKADLSTSRPVLLPSRQHDKEQIYGLRFNKPALHIKSKPKHSAIGPVGRQSYGPTMRRAMSLPDLRSESQFDEDFPTLQEAYHQRYRRLPKAQRDTYKEYRKQISLRDNPMVKQRMVKAPTIGAIREYDINRLSQMGGQRNVFSTRSISTRDEAARERRNRRHYIAERAVLPPTIPQKEKYQWLQKSVRETIPEEPEEEEEDSDPLQTTIRETIPEVPEEEEED